MSADANNTSLALCAETTYGVLPGSPEFKKLRLTGESIGHTKDTVLSAEIRDDRQRSDLVEVGAQADGGINIELSFAEYQDLLQGALGSVWKTHSRTMSAALAIAGQTITVTTPGSKASAVLTFSGNAIAAETITINGIVYTFRTSPAAANEVLIGGGAANTIINLVAAINGNPIGLGTSFGAGTVANPYVSAVGTSTTVTITALANGVAANAYGTTETLTNGAWGGSTMAGGHSNFSGMSGGGFVRVAGAANAGNNGIKRVVSVASDGDTMTLAVGSIVADQSGVTLTVSCKDLRNGVAKPSWTLERTILNTAGVKSYQSYAGMMVDIMTLSMQPKQIVTGTISFMGLQGATSNSTLATTTDEPTSDPVMNGTSHVAQLWQDAAMMTSKVKQLDMSINNNLRGKDALGHRGLFEVGVGSLDVTGKLSVYFDDNTLYQELINHDDSGLAVVVTDPNGDSLCFSFPRIKFGKGNPNAAAINSDVMIDVDFTAIRDSTLGVTVIVNAIPA